MLARSLRYVHRIGADENGLGARLGPLVVTAVLARVDETGERTLSRRLPKKLRADLDDSKALVSHTDFSLGEAWARVLAGEGTGSPAELFERLTLDPLSTLRSPCPEHVVDQCWKVDGETFVSNDDTLDRLRAHRDELMRRGVEILAVRSSVVCTKRLNQARELGKNRFICDLYAMERLVLELRRTASMDVLAVCGKVGSMAEYAKFFGPLSNFLCAIIEQGRKRSAYHLPGVGEVHFVRDADAQDPLVMLASLVGKWIRELLMGRVAHYYVGHDEPRPSGYHDPDTARFVDATALLRRQRHVPEQCFERARDPLEA